MNDQNTQPSPSGIFYDEVVNTGCEQLAMRVIWYMGCQGIPVCSMVLISWPLR
jgi:hypothetical protein